MKILIVLPRQLGDILLGLCLAQELRSFYGSQAKIHWYSHAMGKLVLNEHPWVDRVHYYPKGFWAELGFVLKLRAEKFDIVVDAMANPRTALASFLTGAKQRISFETRWNRNWAYTHLVDRNRLLGGYVGKKRLALLEPLGILSQGSGIPKLLSSHVETLKVADWLLNNGLKGEKWVAFSPTHRHAVRKWPGDSFVSLAAKLVEEKDFKTVWLWGPGELPEIEILVEQLKVLLRKKTFAKNIIDVSEYCKIVPLLNLKETANLCSYAQFFVGNSNGLSHVAAAGGCRTIVLHGPTSPSSWTPEDPYNHLGIQRKSGCVSCQKNRCTLLKRECLDDLPVSEVFSATEYFSN